MSKKGQILIFFIFLGLAVKANPHDSLKNRSLYFYFYGGPTLHAQAIYDGQSNARYSFSTYSLMLGTDIGFFVVPTKFSLGLSYEIHYSIWNINYAPICLNARYFLNDGKSSNFIYSQYGRAFINNADYHGNIFAVGLGRKLFYTNKLATLVSLGYNLHRISPNNPATSDPNNLYTSGFELKMGFYF